jgi:hypothetical protein
MSTELQRHPASEGALQRRDQGAAAGGAGHPERHAGPEAREDRHQHGRRPCRRPAVADRGLRRRPHGDLRPEADRHQGPTSIANFKLREGQAIGVKVTLRGDRMWEFLDRLISVAIPRIRDFRGLPAHSWDGHGNYTFGLNEQTMFAEIDPDKIDQPRGMDITIVTTATTTRRQGAARCVRLPLQEGRRRRQRAPQEEEPWPRYGGKKK